MRDTKRPSAGVHIDEATHPVDVLLNYLFPVLGLSTKNVALTVSKREYSKSIANPELQAKFYGEDHVPLAMVDYKLSVDGILIEGHSSFMEAPQRREIWLTCDKDVELRVAFDDNKTDHFTIFVQGKQQGFEEFKDPNKLLLEWQTFLQSFQGAQGTVKGLEHPPKIPTLKDTFKDIQITEALGTVPLNQEEVLLK